MAKLAISKRPDVPENKTLLNRGETEDEPDWKSSYLCMAIHFFHCSSAFIM
jgi:hypothetical protein